MNIALARLVEALCQTLQDNVRPELQTDHARGQLAAVLDILGKLGSMAVWSPEAAAQQAAVLTEACADVRARVLEAGIELQLPPPARTGEHDDALAAAQVHLIELTDWLFDAGAALPGPVHAGIDAILRQAMREQLIIQRKLIPLTDFGAMTTAANP
ncbi:hypothetical protein [Caenimonas sp. SL110]|uniref:hypothetical protein n=1 Tax=Caenimonas sp. SL110 TaxID=1450524 RepID=UPI0006537277|nr:hypothetical protein [Caenimonas sp. SL110]